jgi:hypothetical protein
MSNTMSYIVLDILQGRVIDIIAMDSYRAWQLLRLTCKAWHDQLGEYGRYEVMTIGDCSGPLKTVTRAMFISFISSVILGRTQSGASEWRGSTYMSERQFMRVSAYDFTSIGDDTIIKCYTGDYDIICKIVRGVARHADNVCCDLYILGARCTLIIAAGYTVSRAKDHIRGHLPEIYHVTVDLPIAAPPEMMGE